MKKNFSLYYSIFFIFILYIYLYINKIENIKQCNWKPISISYDKSKQKICKEYLNFLDSLDIYYFIGFGSLLGAVRNGGVIKKDVDIDIIVPISKNYRIFKCMNNVNISDRKYNSKYVLLSQYSTICNHSRLYYSKILYNYILHNTKSYKIIKTSFTKLVMAFYLYNNLYIDIYPIIANEWIYRSFDLCKCKFCEKYTYCNNDAYNIVKLIYGEDYLNPKTKKSSLDKNIISVTVKS